MARSGTPIDVDKLRGENARKYLVKRQDVDVRTAGSSMIQMLQDSVDIVIRSYTGADPGTGIVLLGLKPTGVAPGQYNTFVVSDDGRIIKAWNEEYSSGNGGNANSIANQSSYKQTASFWIDGSGRMDGQLTAGNAVVSGALHAGSAVLDVALPISSGGTGVKTVAANYVFAGPISGAANAPQWRQLSLQDIPSIPWNRLVDTPTTVAGYGIVDVYTRTQSDARYITLSFGSTTQYLRGDNTWAELTTAAVTEATSLYYTDARARAALSSSGNVQYNSISGHISLVPTPAFDSITINTPPTQATHGATKQYVDDAVGTSGGTDARDRFVVLSSAQTSYTLNHQPIPGSTQVFLNGLALFEGELDDYTTSNNTVTLNASTAVAQGDVVQVRYRHY